MKQIWIIFFLLVTSTSGAFAAGSNSAVKRNPDKLPFAYKVFRFMVTDLDELLTKQSYTPVSCTYYDLSEKKQISYSGSVTVCAFESLRDLLKDRQSIGEIQLRLKEADGREVRGTLHWRPTQNGWSGLWREISFQYLEIIRVKAKKWFKVDVDSRRPPFTENLLGTMVIDFEVPPKVLKVWSKYDRVTLGMKPTGLRDAKTEYVGQMILGRQVEMETDRRMTITFTTDWNIAKPLRAYDVKGGVKDAAE